MAELEYCVDRATQWADFSAWARVCEADLQRREPRRWPPLTEIVPAGGPIAWEPESAPVDLETPPIE